MATLKTILARFGERANTSNTESLNDLGADGAYSYAERDAVLIAEHDSFIEHYNATYDFEAGLDDVYQRAGLVRTVHDPVGKGRPAQIITDAVADTKTHRWRRWAWRHLVPHPHDPPLIALAVFGVVLNSGWLIVACLVGLAYAAWWRRTVRRHAAAARLARRRAGYGAAAGESEGRW
jgi:hypothetical protein